MTRYREFDDGTRVYPKRGTPPAPEGNYVVDSNDPFIHHPIYPECRFRVQLTSTNSCCPDQKILSLACQKGFKVTHRNCLECIKCGRRDQ